MAYSVTVNTVITGRFFRRFAMFLGYHVPAPNPCF